MSFDWGLSLSLPKFFDGERWVRYLISLSFMLLLISWVLPNHYSPWLAAYQEFLCFFSVLLLVLALFVCGDIFCKREFFCILLLCLVPVSQYVFGVIYFFGDAFIASAYLLGFGFMLLVGCTLSSRSITKEFFIRYLALIFLAGALLSLWLALRQWLLLSGSIWVVDLPQGGRPFANLAQPNNLATLLCMGVAGAFYLYECKLISRSLIVCSMILLIFGVALTQSRTPWVACAVVGFFWWWKARDCEVGFRFLNYLGFVAFYAACVFALPFLANYIGVSGSDPLVRAASTERLELWWQFSHAVFNGPLWGYGWGQVSVAQVGVSTDYPVAIMTEHSHNFFLDIFLWNGPLLGGLIVIFFSVWVFGLFSRVSDVSGFFSLLSAIFLLVHGMFEFPLEYAFFLFPLGLLLGFASAGLNGVVRLGGGRSWLIIFFVMGVVGVSLVWREYRIVEEDYRLMRFENARIGTLRSTSPGPDVELLSQLREYIKFARTPAVEGMSASEIEWMRKVAHRYPYYTALFRYSLALGLNGYTAEASDQLLVLRALYGERYYIEAIEVFRSMKIQHGQLADVIGELEGGGR